MSKYLPLCCCCSKVFDSVSNLENHSYEQFLNANTESYDICGTNIFICYGCLRYFRGYESYEKHFRWVPKPPKSS